MQIVIEIEDEIYNELKKDEDFLINFAKNPYKTMILKGTVLPEHGRLKDSDEIIEKLSKEIPYFIDNSITSAYTDGLAKAKYVIDSTDTILEAWGNEE